MSTLSVITIQNATNIQGPSVSTLPSFQDSNGTEHGRLCRAFVNFNGSGSVSANQTIRASFNVSTVFKNGTGDYTVNFTNALADANYIWVVGGATVSTINTGVVTASLNSSGTPLTYTTSSFRILNSESSTGGVRDNPYISISFFR